MAFMTGPFLLSVSVFVVSFFYPITLFVHSFRVAD